MILDIEDIYFFDNKRIKYYLIKWYWNHKTFQYNGEKKHYIVEELENS